MAILFFIQYPFPVAIAMDIPNGSSNNSQGQYFDYATNTNAPGGTGSAGGFGILGEASTDTITVAGTVTFLGLPDARPDDLALTIYANGVATRTDAPFLEQIEVAPDAGVWRYSFTGLSRLDENGVEFNYEVKAENTIYQGRLYRVADDAAIEVNGGMAPANADFVCVGLVSIGGAYCVEREEDDPPAHDVMLTISTEAASFRSGGFGEIYLGGGADRWEAIGLPGYDPLTKEHAIYRVQIARNTEGYQAAYENPAPHDQATEYAYDGGTVVNRYTHDDAVKPMPTLFSAQSATPTNYTEKGSQTYTARVNWNDSNDVDNRPASTSSMNPLIYYKISGMNEPALLTPEILEAWGITNVDLTPDADTLLGNYWDYKYSLPNLLEKTEYSDEEADGVKTSVSVEYSFNWDDALSLVEKKYFTRIKPDEENTVICTLKKNIDFTKSWKDGVNKFGTRQDAEALLKRLEFTKYYSVLGQNYETSMGTLFEYLNNTDPSRPTVKVIENDGEWTITVTNLYAYTDPDGDAFHYYIVETDNEMAIDGDNNLAEPENVKYVATYKNVGNRAEETNACFEGGTITNTLSDEVTIDMTKVWQDDGLSESIAARPSGILKLRRYPDISTRDHGNASPVTGAEMALISTGTVYSIDFTDSPAKTNTFPRFDIDGNEYVYIVKESLTGGNDTNNYTRYYENADGTVGTVDALFNGGKLMNRRTGSIDLSVTKRWNAAARQDLDASVTLLVERRTGTYEFEPVTGSGLVNGRYTIDGFRAEVIEKEKIFEDLPQFDENGIEYEYRVSEAAVKVGTTQIDLTNSANYTVKDGKKYCVIDGYTYELKEETDAQGRIKLTNTLVGQTEVRVYKIWDGLTDAHKISGPPPVTLNVYRDGATVYAIDTNITIGGSSQTSFTISGNDAKIQNTEEDDQEGKWLIISDLPRYDAQGREYKYTVTETDVSGYYTTYSTVRDEGEDADGNKIGVVKTTVTNTPGEDGAYIVARKEWYDYGDEGCRGTVLLDLYHTKDNGDNWDKVNSEPIKMDASGDWEKWISLTCENSDGVIDRNHNNYYIVESGITRKSTKYGVIYDMDYEVEGFPVLSTSATSPTNIGSVTTDAHNYDCYAYTNNGAKRTSYTFRNVRVGTVNIDLSKIWNDDGHQESDVPQEVTLEIRRRLVYEDIDVFSDPQYLINTVVLDGSETPTAWEARIEDLPKYDEKGIPYYYTVRETKVKEIVTSTEHTVTYDLSRGYYTLDDGHQYAVSTEDQRTYGEHTGSAPGPDEYDISVTNARSATKNVVAYKIWKDVVREKVSSAISNPTEIASEEAKLQNEYQSRPDIYFELYQSIDGGTTITAVSTPREVLWTTTGDYGTYCWKGEFVDLQRYTSDGKEITYYVREGQSAMGEYVVEYYDAGAVKLSDTVYPDAYATLRKITDKDIYDVELGATKIWASDADPAEAEGYVPDGGSIVNVRKDKRYLTGRKVWLNLPQGLNAEYFPEVKFQLEIYVDENGDYTPFVKADTTIGTEGQLNGEKTYFTFEKYTDQSELYYLEKYDSYGLLTRYLAKEIFDEDQNLEYPPGYLKPIYNDYELTVTNTYDVNQTDTVTVKVSKDWQNIPQLYSGTYPKATLELMRVMTAPDGKDMSATAEQVPINEENRSAGYLIWEDTYVPSEHHEKTFENLPKYGYNGYPFRYYFWETLNGYTVNGLGTNAYDNDDKDDDLDIFKYEVTNTYTGIDEAYIKLGGTKYWVDSSDKYDKRPDDLELKVYRKATGSTGDPEDITDDVTITWGDKTGNDWTYTVKAADDEAGTDNPDTATEDYTLYRYAPNGAEYIYYVAEVKPDHHYKASRVNGTEITSGTWVNTDERLTIQGSAPISDSITINFRNTLETTSVSVKKIWMKNVAGAPTDMELSEFAMMLPESITFQVQYWNGTSWADLKDKDNTSITHTVTRDDCIAAMTSGNEMTVAFSGLPKYGNTVLDEIKYRLVETKIGDEDISGYPGGSAGGFTVINNDAAHNATAPHTVTNTLETNKLTIKKEFDDEDNQDGLRPTVMTFTIERDGVPTQTITVDLTTVGNSVGAWEDWETNGVTVYVPKYQANGSTLSTYEVTEQAIIGYTLQNPKASTQWTKPDPNPGVDAEKVFVFNNQHAAGEMEITVAKDWADTAASLVGGAAETRPDSVTMTLQRRFVGSADDADWTVVPNWLYDSVSYTAQVTLEPTNPSDVGGTWKTHTWKGLPCRTNDDGAAGSMKVYEYRVVETPVTGYTTSYSVPLKDVDSGTITVTNTLLTISLPVQKVWSPSTNQFAQFPSVDVELQYRLGGSGAFVDTSTTKQLTSPNWTDSFTALPKMDKNGDEYQYTVKETKIGGATYDSGKIQHSYNSAVSGGNDGVIVTNTLVPRNSITVTKDWIDADNQDGIRPANVIVRLVKDRDITGEEVVSSNVVLNGSLPTPWTYTWDNLPKYRADGVTLCEYTVEETLPSGGNYSVTYSVNGGVDWKPACDPIPDTLGGAVVTVKNTYTPKTMGLTVTKIWDDQSDRFGLRPASVKARLMSTTEADGITGAAPVAGAQIAELTAGSTPPWSHTWGNLPVMSGGKTIYYSVQELNASSAFETIPLPAYEAPVYGYELAASSGGEIKDVNGNDVSIGGSLNDVNPVHKAEITNTLDEVKVTVDKTWDDYSDMYGLRPDSLTFTLQRRIVGSGGSFTNVLDKNNVPVTISIAKDSDENVQSDFDNLPRYNAGGQEYEYRIVETHFDPDSFGDQPVTSTTGDPTIGEFAAGSTKYNFTTATTGNGTAGYTSTITNKLDIETITLTGTKDWNDQDNKYSSRPANIAIAVYYKDDTTGNIWTLDSTVEQDMIAWVTDDANNRWTYSVTPLLKYSPGDSVAREYGIVETAPGYYVWTPVTDGGMTGGIATGTPDGTTGNINAVDLRNTLTADAILAVTKVKASDTDIPPGPADSEFTFNVYISREPMDDNNTGILYTGDYDVFDAGNPITDPPKEQKTTDTSGDIVIIATEKFVLRDLPTGYYYRVAENDHHEYELVVFDCEDLEGTLISGENTAMAVNKTITELAINNDTPNPDTGDTNAGGKVIVVDNSDDPEHDGDYSHDDYKENKVKVAWLPEQYWDYGESFTIIYTRFGDQADYRLTISDYLDENGNPKNPSEWNVTGTGDLATDFPDILLKWNDAGNALLLTLSDSAADMPRKVKVDVQFVPTLAVSNVTKDNEHGKVMAQGGVEDTKADGAPSNNNTATGAMTSPYRALSVFAMPESGYIVDEGRIAIRNMSDPDAGTIFLEVAADGSFKATLTTKIAGVQTQIEITGRLDYTGDDVQILFDSLPVPLQVDVEFIAKPVPLPNDPNDDSPDDTPGDPPDGLNGRPRSVLPVIPPTGLYGLETTNDPTVPQTGDDTPILPVIIVGLIAAAGAIVLGRKKRYDGKHR